MLVTTLGIAAAGLTFAQAGNDGCGLTARQLYYQEKPIAVRAAPKRQTPAKKSVGGVRETARVDPGCPAGAESAPAQGEAPFVGLRCSLIDPATSAELDPVKVFHSGDRVRVKLESNTNGYLYVLNKDPRGQWTPLFPSAEIINNNNWIERGRAAIVPSSQNFIFDNDPGKEVLFIVLSKDREPSIDRLIQSLQNTPENRPKTRERVVNQASNNRPQSINQAVEQLRGSLTSRAIQVESQRSKNDGSGENAVYVAASDPAMNRIVTELILRHE